MSTGPAELISAPPNPHHTMAPVTASACALLALAATALASASAGPNGTSPAAPPLGHARLADFTMAAEYTNLNHGSYGSVPQAVQEGQSNVRARIESCPDQWFRYDRYEAIDGVRARVAAYLAAAPKDVVFVDNASHGMNAVLRSLKVPAGQKILYLSCAYQMVKNTLEFQHSFAGDRLVELNVTWPLDSAALVEQVDRYLEAHRGEVFVASLSHIVSVPGVILPIKALAAVCRKHGVLSLIDGAHAMGQIPVNITDLDPDFYVTNGHKWLYSPKGSAVLWTRPGLQDQVFPTTISYEGQGNSSYQVGFSYQGTGDCTPYMAMADALDYRAELGEEAIFTYMHWLAVSGGEHLAKVWQTEALHAPHQMGAMVDVRVPTSDPSVTGWLAHTLLEKHHTFVPFYKLATGGSATPSVYGRVSAQIYTELSDFEKMGRDVLALLKERGVWEAQA